MQPPGPLQQSSPLVPPIVGVPVAAAAPEPSTTTQPVTVVRRPWWVTPVFAAMTAVTIAALTLVSWSLAHRGGDQGPSDAETPGAGPTLRDAHRTCHWRGDLSDGGRTLYLDMKGEDSGSGTLLWRDMECYLSALEAPDYVLRHMESTRALDGRQSDTWGSFEASWTYHPDDGLDVLIRQID